MKGMSTPASEYMFNLQREYMIDPNDSLFRCYFLYTPAIGALSRFLGKRLLSKN